MISLKEKIRREKISKTSKGRRAWNKGTKGLMGLRETHPNWKGGKSIDVRGYIRIYDPDNPSNCHGHVYEHRVVIEKHLGRKLKSSEHIHHLNGNRTDNRLENLIVITNSQHSKIHNPHGFHPNRKIR